jgi:hypothetical protein
MIAKPVRSPLGQEQRGLSNGVEFSPDFLAQGGQAEVDERAREREWLWKVREDLLASADYQGGSFA